MKTSVHFEFEAIGTHWVIDIFDVSNQSDLEQKIKEEINNFSKVFSRFDQRSEIYLASKKPHETSGHFAAKIKVPKKYLELIKTYKKFYDLTDGSFTPLIGNVLRDAGYDENYSLKPKKINPVLKWEDVIEFNGDILKIKKPWMLDFGAGGKGFIVDLIGQFLEDNGIKSFCIDASGDILCRGLDPIKVGLENPKNLSQVLGIVDLGNGSICASAGNRRNWGKYHHIFNPKSLESVNEILAVWVIADNAFTADCLATGLFLKDPEVFKEFDFEYLILYPDFTIKKSANFPAEMYTAGKSI